MYIYIYIYIYIIYTHILLCFADLVQGLGHQLAATEREVALANR